jgi:histidinol-phosphate/aromatic aminotransferase/cobyric acid decarboxylase-like protein
MILRIVDLILFKFMYASNYSKNLITAEEKVAELMKQRDAAVAERDRLHAEVKRLNAQVALDDKAKLLLVRCNTSDRLRAEKADARIKELENGIEKLYLELRNGKKPINL